MLTLTGKKHFKFLGLPVKSVRMAAIGLGFVYFCGMAGLLYPPTRPYFEIATPFNLLLSAVVLLSFHSDWNRAFYWFCSITLLFGFFIEVAGVHTTLIFGSYEYGPTLGAKVWEVPLVIGVNWLILVYCTGIICQQLRVIPVLKAALAALMMVMLDVLIEPIAIIHDYWQWQNNEIPLQNYAGWFVAAWLLLWLFYAMPFVKKNPFAKYLFVIMISFFAVLNLLHKVL